MKKTSKAQELLKDEAVLQYLNERGNTGYSYGPQTKVSKTKTEGRKVTMNGYTLASNILKAVQDGDEEYVEIILGSGKVLAIDLLTREALYINENTGEETYLDTIIFHE